MDSVTYLINGILWIILCIPLLNAFTKTIDLIKLVRFRSNNLLSNQTIISLEKLNNLSNKEFAMWCCYFLNRLGYKDASIDQTEQKSYDLILCKKDSKNYCVKVLRFTDKKTPGLKINSECINVLAGIMIKEKIYNGLIITTEIPDESFNAYLDSFKAPFSMNAIDGEMLVAKYELMNTFALAPR